MNTPTTAEEADRNLARLMRDLDRCEHGRHEGDICSSCGGPSKGGIIPTGTPIGFTMSGNPIVMPPRGQRHDPAAWTGGRP